jgi:hypothetical protein
MCDPLYSSAMASHEVIVDNDRTIAPAPQRFTAEGMKATTLVLPTSHVAMLAKPKELSEFIAQAASSLPIAQPTAA